MIVVAHLICIQEAAVRFRFGPSIQGEKMLKWDISYPDAFRCVIDNSVFTILKKLNNKYDVHVRAKIGDEFFEKDLYDFETLQKANEMSESIYKGMNRK